MQAPVEALSDRAEATLARLMPHLHRRPDLPGLQRASRQVQRIASRATARVQDLVDAVADDPGLSARLLRLSNSALHASADAGRNASLDRAVRLLGFATVQHLAAGLPLLDRQPDGPATRLAREDFLRALLAGHLARELSLDWRDTDATQLAALFQNLGRLLVATHLPDDARAIHAATPRTHWPLVEREQRAAQRRLGWRYGDLGLHVARHWGWPQALRHSLPVGDDWPSHRPADGINRRRWQARLANELADVLLYVDPRQWPQACEALHRQAGGATAHAAEGLQQALARARLRLEPLAELVGVPLGERREWQRGSVMNRPLPNEAAGNDTVDAPIEPPSAMASAAARADEAAAGPADEQLLQLLHTRLSARRAVLWRAPAQGTRLQLQAVLGQPLPADVRRHWHVDPVRGRDLFSRLCRHGHDSLIDDAHAPSLSRHLPAAWVRGVHARSFLVLPLQQQGRVQGLLYLDRRDDDPFTLDGDAMQLVRTLRAQTLA